jgi:prevent-host-death family protein
MATTIPQRELRNQNAAIIDAVAGGESFVITRNGTPVAELRPISGPQRTFVPRAQIAAVAARSGPVDAAQFRADLDAFVDQSL